VSMVADNEILGRERELEVIRSYIHAPRVLRVLLMWGPVGSGRSFLIRHILRTERNALRVFLDLSPAPKHLRIPGVHEIEECRRSTEECVAASVHEGLDKADGREERVIIAVDGVMCEEPGEKCKLPPLVRSLARLIEVHSTKLRIIMSVDDLEATLLLGTVAEYIRPLVVGGLDPDSAAEFVKREAAKAGLSLSNEEVANIVGATGGLPYAMLVVIHEYRGDVEKWMRDMTFKTRWKLTLISTLTGRPVREVAKDILDMHGRQVITLPRTAYEVLRAALKTNLVYVDEYSVVRLQLPIYRGILHSIAYGGPLPRLG